MRPRVGGGGGKAREKGEAGLRRGREAVGEEKGKDWGKGELGDRGESQGKRGKLEGEGRGGA